MDAVDCTDLRFEPVDLPHDWLIYNTLALYENSIGWYRKILARTISDIQNGQQQLIYFEGVYMDSSLYVNGQFGGEWKYGYSSFEHDISASLVEGDNEIIVKVVHQHPFNLAGHCVEGIGNNVTLEFSHMEFSVEGASKLVVWGRSPIDKNTIHIQFSDENGEKRQIVEFTKTEGYEEQAFELEKVDGIKKVTFIFLPGSIFDFKGFRFER